MAVYYIVSAPVTTERKDSTRAWRASIDETLVILKFDEEQDGLTGPMTHSEIRAEIAANKEIWNTPPLGE
jgi:hypothetical protein